MKRGSKKQQPISEETSSGSSADSAEKEEELTEDRRESLYGPTSQKQTETENKNEPRYMYGQQRTGIQIQPYILRPTIVYSSSHHTDPVIPSRKPVYDIEAPGPHGGLLSRPIGTGGVGCSTPSTTPSELPPDSSLPHQPGSILEQFSSKKLSDLLDFSSMFSPPVPRGQETKQVAKGKMAEINKRAEPGSVSHLTKHFKDNLKPPTVVVSSPNYHYYLSGSEQELRGQDKRDEDANPPAKRGRIQVFPCHQGPELSKDLSPEPTRQLMRQAGSTNMEQIRSPFSYLDQQFPPVYPSYSNSPTFIGPYVNTLNSGLSLYNTLLQHHIRAQSSLIDPDFYSQDSSHMFSPPVSRHGQETKQVKEETETIAGINEGAEPASVSQFTDYQDYQDNQDNQDKLCFLPQIQNSCSGSDQELKGQEKKEEEASSPARGAYGGFGVSYEDPELLKHLSPESTRLMKPGSTDMEQRRSPLIHHPYQQLSAPTPEYINTETPEEAGSGSGSLSVSEGPEPVLYEDPGPDQELSVEAEPPIMAELLSATKALPPSSDVHFSSTDSCWTRRASSSVPGSVSIPSLSHMTSAANNNPRRAASLPDMKLQSSFEEFTPDFSEDNEDDGSYRFQCSCPGLYQCSVSGLVFDMEAEGDVVYRTVPWNRRLLVQHHKKPAGPLFDMECVQQSVRQLHLPHCQIRPTAGSLAVAHVTDDGIKFITPLKITETHLVINITGFSAFGIVKDEDSPPDPVRALVLLFYRPPDDPDVTSVLSVLLLPRNIVIRDLQRTRRKLVGEERFIDASPHCKLYPDQVYTLSTAPEDDLIKVQPTETEFDEESHSSYFTSFQVILKTVIRDISLSLKDKKSSCCVWERDVCLLPSRAKILTLRPNEKLLDIRSCFIDGTSGPVLNSLLDKLLEKRVFTDSERESADEMQNRRDKARFVVDTVRKKGDGASSEMIDFLCEVDPFLSRRLGLM